MKRNDDARIVLWRLQFWRQWGHLNCKLEVNIAQAFIVVRVSCIYFNIAAYTLLTAGWQTLVYIFQNFWENSFIFMNTVTESNIWFKILNKSVIYIDPMTQLSKECWGNLICPLRLPKLTSNPFYSLQFSI